MRFLDLFCQMVYAKEDITSSSTDIIPSYYNTGFKFSSSSIGDILGGENGLLRYIYVIAGLVLLLMLISGGIGLMTSGGNPDKMKAGYGKITSALIGFLIVFISYIVAQLLETILGVDIL